MASNTTDLVIRGKIVLDTKEAETGLGVLTKDVQQLVKVQGSSMPITKHIKEFTQTVRNSDGTLTKNVQTLVRYTNAMGRSVTATGDLTRNTKGQITNTKEWTVVANKATTSTKQLADAQQKVTNTSNNLGLSMRSLGETFVKVAKFKIVTELLMTFINMGNEAIEIVREFDDAMVEFAKVSTLSGKALDNYAQKLGELGEITMKSRTQMLESATEFVKSGYSEEQAADLAQVATMFQNVADSELSAGDSASYVISQMKAFGMTTTEEAQSIIDKTNEVRFI